MTRPSTPSRLPPTLRIAFLLWIGLSTAGCGARGTTAGPEPDGARRSPDEPAIVPLAEAVPGDAEVDPRLFVLHRTSDRLLFEIPDSLLGRDMLLISRIARVPADLGGFIPAGYKAEEQVLRWERRDRAAASDPMTRAHLRDTVARVDAILERARTGD